MDAPRMLTFDDRATVAGVAEALIDSGDREHATILIDAVRCCGEFPECSHVVAWVETRDRLAAEKVDPERLAAIAACPTPVYHETHRYCPSCPWTEADG